MFARLNTAALAPIPIASDSTAVAVNPGDRRRSRTPYRRSCTSVSTEGNPHMSRVSSRIAVTLPNARRASRSACARIHPALNQRLAAQLDVQPDLLGQLVVQAIAPEHRDRSPQQRTGPLPSIHYGCPRPGA